MSILLIIKRVPHAATGPQKEYFCAKGSFTKQISYPSVAKSDEIGKIAHLAFSREIMGADILEKLSLTAEKSLFWHGELHRELSLMRRYTQIMAISLVKERSKGSF